LPQTITGLEAGPAAGGTGAPGLVGAVLPLGGAKDNHLAELAAEGLAVAAGATDGKGIAAVETRAATDKTAAAEAVDHLAHDNAIAIVGPIGDGSVDAAGGRADALGIPLISLSPHAAQRAASRFVFHIRHSPEARARTLAQRALAQHVTRFALFAPDSDYGRFTTAAFRDAIEHGGGTIVASVTYPPATKSFATIAKKASGDWEGVFVADAADKLALLAPALAAAGHVARPVGTRKSKLLGGVPVLLLSTAEELTPSFLAAAGRYAEGGLLAPGFYPDDADPNARPFVDRFVAAYGRTPGASEAYAYDAAQLATAAGSSGRAGLAQALSGGQLPGVTGAIRFDADHRRADPGLVYIVVEETGGSFAIRTAR
jgi:ABC-type branched-subunit amino acid transport system substrate-binding protein